MAKININFDVKSIKNAIKQVQAIQDKFKKEIPERFVAKCLGWVQERANEYLSMFNIAPSTIGDIKSRWETNVVGNVGRLINTSEKAVFVEFGVGRVGAVASHPSANQNNPPYEYNVQSTAKDSYGKWRFKVDDAYGVDLVEGYYRINGDTVTTSGSPATLYLYNAMMDLVSSRKYVELWQQTLKETI